MRKVFGIVLAMLLLCSSAFATGEDYSSMSVPELQEVINAARNTLLTKTAQADGKLFIMEEDNGLQIYLTGKGEENWLGTYELEIVVINNGNNAVSIAFDNIVVNGWETNTFGESVQDVGAGKKKKDAFPIIFEDTDISSISEVEEVEISFHTFDPSSYKTISEFGPYTIYYDGSTWSK